MNYNNINDLFEVLSNDATSKRLFAEINGRKITYRELVEDIRKLFTFFEQKGLQKGDRIVLSTKDEYHTSLFFLAFLRYGIVTVFLDPDVPAKRAIAIIKKAAPQGLVMDEGLFLERDINESLAIFQLKIKKKEQKKGFLFKKLLGNKKAATAIEATDFPAILEQLSTSVLPLKKIEAEDFAYILFTSGTTSKPKGVIITQRNVFAHLNTLTNVYGLDENVRLLNILMLYHADGCIQGPLLAIYNQSTWLRPFSFELSKIDELFHAIYKYRITHFIAVPTILSFMDKFSEGFEDSFQTADFKFIISCASKLESKLWLDFEEKFQTKLLNVYGLTETVAGSLFCGLNAQTRKIGTEGIPVDCEAKIIKTDGTDAGVNETGELYLKGEHLFFGYFQDLEATEKVLKNNWLNTGDLAFRDDDGFYHITGRSKNTINSGGINIYPEQITEMVNTHPTILESVCLGIAEETFGEKLVCAYVVRPNQTLEKLNLIHFLRPLLEQNQIPKEFYLFSDLPKGLSGKVQINEIRELILKQSSNASSVDSDTYEMIIKEVASEAFGASIEDISSLDNSHTLEGWDSMGHLVFITSLEKRFDVSFSTPEMLTMNSLVGARRILMNKLGVN
ncbi:AMP-binding protein [Pedobacter gandavensis]|uniref:AMP-binding protein n=1 Tax=Pedobacter gandavensis TaxID=2679963 RepID=UPI00292CE2C7|nr:AMP-binding protein [Pedobacter gandavensis]